MDRHQQALAKLIRDFVALDPICSVVAIGSVGRGDYHEESDIDINVVTWRYDEMPKLLSWEHARELVNWDGVRLDEGFIDGIKTHLNCSTPLNYHGLVMSGSVLRWGSSRILYDPSGIATWGESCVRRFLEDNPRIAEECRHFEAEYLRYKKDQSYPRRHRTQEEFVRSLDLENLRISYGTFASGKLGNA